MKKIFTLLATLAVTASVCAETKEYVVKSSSNGVLEAGQVLSSEGEPVTMTAIFKSSKSKDMQKSGKAISNFNDGIPGNFFTNVSTQARLKDKTDLPSLENPDGVANTTSTTGFKLDISTKLDSLKVYFEASSSDNGRGFNLFNRTTGEFMAFTAMGSPNKITTGSQYGFIAEFANINPGTYTLYNTGYTAGFVGIRYIVDDGPVIPSLDAPEITYDENTGEVTISHADLSTVYYTTDGTLPSEESIKYEAPFTVEDNTVVKAIAVGDGENFLSSPVTEVTVLLAGVTVENPVITSYNGTFYIACETPGATIKYSYDNETWEDFTACVTLFESKTVYAKAVREGATDSEVISAEVDALPVPKVDGEYSKIIAIGYGSFVAGKTSNYMEGAAGVEKSAYGMGIKREEGNFVNNSIKLWTASVNDTRTGINDGAKNTLVIPENLEVNRIVFYSYVNAESGVAGWSEVNGEEIDITKVPMTCYKNGDYAKNPDKRAFNFDHATGEITFNGEGLIYTLDVWVSHKALSEPWHPETKTSYVNGERVNILHSDADATILYTLDGADPDENNIYTEEAPAAAPARSSMDSATDEDHAGKTYNLAERPIVFNGERLNISYMAIKDGYKPSAVQTLGITGDGTTGIENVAVDSQNGRVEFFNLQGVRVENPSNGIFIRRQGNNVSKVIVK